MKSSGQNRFSGAVYFYLFPQGPPDRAAYQHPLVCLAEGLRELGVSFYSNRDYWRESPDGPFLFRHDPKVSRDDCSVVAIDQFWFCYGGRTPPGLFRRGRRYLTAYFDWADGHVTPSWGRAFRGFDFIFRSHWVEGLKYPENFRPWALGLSNRIIRETADPPPFGDRRMVILSNSRIGHPLRATAEPEILARLRNIAPVENSTDPLEESPRSPYHLLHWRQTGRRHYPDYYRRLFRSAFCSCLSGYLLPAGNAPAVVPLRFRRKGPIRAAQWDSWRLWEALAAGCVALHLDFEKYGMKPPLKPRNWDHYLGADLDDLDGFAERVRNETGRLDEIAAQGRRWALEHYSPRAAAERFLNTVSRRTS